MELIYNNRLFRIFVTQSDEFFLQTSVKQPSVFETSTNHSWSRAATVQFRPLKYTRNSRIMRPPTLSTPQPDVSLLLIFFFFVLDNTDVLLATFITTDDTLRSHSDTFYHDICQRLRATFYVGIHADADNNKRPRNVITKGWKFSCQRLIHCCTPFFISLLFIRFCHNAHSYSN